MILVTGGLGYIGSHTVVELLKSEEVLILDNLYNSEKKVLNRIDQITGKDPVFIEGDIRDEKLLDQIFTRYNIESVIHFAGLKAVGESVEVPLRYYDHNVNGTLTLLKAMAKHKVFNLVFSSSATVYGDKNPVPFHEEMPLSTTNPYGTTKRMIEEMLGDLSRSDEKWRIMILRYFNPVGAHSSGLIGESPKGIPNNLMPFICQVAKGERPKLNIFGNDYNTPDGTGVRDYIHVVDLARGHVLALEYLLKNIGLEIVNLGTGRGYSVLEMVKTFEKVNQISIPFEVVNRRSGDIASCYASTDKAKVILKFDAHKNLEDMCADAWYYMNLGENQ